MGSPKVVVVDHYDSYTWNLVHLVAAVTGVPPTVVQHDETTLDFLLRFQHIVLSPGPGHPAEPLDFSVGRALVVEGDRPVLGVCLGLQGLVTAYGGSVQRGVPAHGEVAAIQHDGRGVFEGLPQDFTAVRYHSLQAVRLPDCLEVSATCAGPEGLPPVVMGVRHRTRPLEGVQFHPESILSEYGEALMANFLR
ncbi:Anthranilate synthase, component II [metagenome]|uniref:Anthranilate synthase, component II n=1 Tax=metagenome TaxID=256318 RepID=A0A2P2BYR6_9ZZZZ